MRSTFSTARACAISPSATGSCRKYDARLADAPVAGGARARVVGGAGAVARGVRLPVRVSARDGGRGRLPRLAALLRLQRAIVLRRHGARPAWRPGAALPDVRRELQPGLRGVVRPGQPGALAPQRGSRRLDGVLSTSRLARAPCRPPGRRRGRLALHVRLARGALRAQGPVDLRDGPGPGHQRARPGPPAGRRRASARAVPRRHARLREERRGRRRPDPSARPRAVRGVPRLPAAPRARRLPLQPARPLGSRRADGRAVGVSAVRGRNRRIGRLSRFLGLPSALELVRLARISVSAALHQAQRCSPARVERRVRRADFARACRAMGLGAPRNADSRRGVPRLSRHQEPVARATSDVAGHDACPRSRALELTHVWHRGNRQARPQGDRGRSASQTDARRAPPSRAGRRGPAARRAGRTRPPPAGDHRRGGRPPAHGQRGRDHLDRLQRRDLQPRRAAPGPRGAGPPLPDAQRHRDDRARVRRRWRALRRAPGWHVRLRALGSAPGAAAPRARSARHQAAVLHVHAGRAPVRVGDQGDSGRPPEPAGARRHGRSRVPRHALGVRSADVLPRRRNAAPRADADVVGRGGDPDAPLLAAAGHARRGARRPRGACRVSARAPDRRRSQPPDDGCPSRAVSLRRHRLECAGGADGGNGARARAHVLGRLRRARRQRARLGAARRRPDRRRAPRGDALARSVLRGPAAAHLARGRAYRHPGQRPPRVRVAPRPRPRQGRADRRGRRRAVPRLQPLPDRRAESPSRRRLGREASGRGAAAHRRARAGDAGTCPAVYRRDVPRATGDTARPLLRRLRRLSGGVAARPLGRRRAARAGSPCHRPRAFRGRAGRLPRPHEPRRSPDVPGRAADEAGPDEYVGLDREPRAVPGPHGGRVRGGDAGAVQARRLADEGRGSEERIVSARVLESPSPLRVATGARPDRRIPSLDGLRAVSIALVVLGHLCGTSGFVLPGSFANILAPGELGVRVFFVISGFLITKLLLEEAKRTGRISLLRFYLRRTFRIFPPYYAFILVLIVLDAARWITLSSGDLVHTLTYTANYHAGRSWNVGHAWSLSVEEQFYLLWPAALLVLGRWGGLRVALAFIAAAPLVRLGLWTLVPAARDTVGVSFETVADAIAIGCELALGREWLHSQPRYRQLLRSRWLILAPVVALLAGLLAELPRLDFLFGFTLRNVCIGLCIDWCVTYPTGRVGRILNSRPLVFVGVISYSIYLWQQLFLNRHVVAAPTSFPLNLALVVLAALASYYVVERPTLRLRQRIEVRLFAGRRPNG